MTVTNLWQSARDPSLYWPRNMAKRLTARVWDQAPMTPKDARERALNTGRCALWLLLQTTQDEEELYRKWIADCGLIEAEVA